MPSHRGDVTGTRVTGTRPGRARRRGATPHATDKHVFAVVPSGSEGLAFHDDWDNIGQRLTDSGSVTVSGVRAPWSDALGYVD